MTVGRQRLGQSNLAHHHEARAIREREVLVGILKEQLARFLEAVAVDTLPSEPRAPIDLLPPPLSRAQPESEPKERERFINDEVRRDQRLAGLERSVTRRAASSVGRVRRVGAPSSPRCRRTAPSPFVQNRIVVRSGPSVPRSPDGLSAVERIVRQRDGRLFRLVYGNNLKGRPAPVDDREARALPHLKMWNNGTRIFLEIVEVRRWSRRSR